MNYLKDLTNKQLKACLLDDMESLRDECRVAAPDDSIDATVSVIEEVFRRIDVYSRGDVKPTVTVTIAPTQEEWFDIAECIWVGALEGGSNHWIEYIDTGDNDLKEGKEIVEKNFEVIMYVDDGEPQPTRWYRNSFDVIFDGITRLDGKRQAQVFDDIGQLDAYDYDLIIQLGTFGKEVFC